MSERESKATENYQAFNLLRSRFGGAKKPQPKPQRREKRRRRDPRFEAPPLKPLVEEGDLSTVPEITQQAQANSPVSTNRNQSEHQVDGSSRSTSPHKMLQPNQSGSSHKCPVPSDTDSIETASLTSQSSAYFSLTPTLGSVTELSDTTSIESFNEYDFKGKNGVHTAHHHSVFEHSTRSRSRHHSAGLGHSRHFSQPLLHRLQRPYSAGTERSPSRAIIVNEISPISPQSKSLEDLLDSSSKVSLISIESENSESTWNSGGVKYIPGKFMSGQPSTEQCKKMNIQDGDNESSVVTEDSITPHASQENESVQNDHDKVGIISNSVSVREIQSPRFAQLVVVEERKRVNPDPIQIRSPSSNNTWMQAREKYRLMKQRSVDALCNTTMSEKTMEIANEEPSELSMVERKAQMFGGVKKQGVLRRTRSFHVGPNHSATISTQVFHHI